MIDGKCPHRHHRVWNNKTELAWDKERPQQEGEFTIKRPMACQLNDATIIHRYSKE